MKPALQTMVIEEDIEKIGAYEALRKVKEIGYEAIEISGHLNLDDETIDQIERACKDFGLEVCALSCEYTGKVQRKSFFPGHRQLSLLNDFEGTVETAKRLNCTTLRFAGQPVEMFHDDVEEMREYFRLTSEFAKRLAEEGITLCAHNHESEFHKIDGKTVWQWSVEECPELHYEMDIFGVQMSGLSPIDFLKTAAGRVDLIHYSDIAIAVKEDPRFTLDMIQRVPLGLGNINALAVKTTAEETGTRYFIMEAAKMEGLDGYQVMKLALDNYNQLV